MTCIQSLLPLLTPALDHEPLTYEALATESLIPEALATEDISLAAVVAVAVRLCFSICNSHHDADQHVELLPLRSGLQ